MTNSRPTGLFATSYLPSVEYVRAMLRYPDLLIEATESYPKQTFRNRCSIPTSNGVLQLVVPVVKTAGNHTLTRDIGISYSEPWNVRHWRAITAAYNASPFFLYYRDGLEEILMQRHEHLIGLNTKLLQQIFRWIKVTKKLHFTEDFVPPNNDNDDHRMLGLKKEPTGDIPRYSQVFDSKNGFVPNISIIDTIFNLGPETLDYLNSIP